MGKLVFRVASDWQEVVRLRTEIEKLKQTLFSMDSTQSPDTFKKLNVQLEENNKKMNALIYDAAKAGAKMETGFKKKIFDASQTVNGFTEKIIKAKGRLNELQKSYRDLSAKYKEAGNNTYQSAALKKQLDGVIGSINTTKDRLFNLTQQQANARLSVKKLRDEYALYRKEGGENVDVTKQIEQAMSNIGKKILGGYSIKEFLSNMVRVRGEFQAADTAIQTLLGSKEKADALMKQVREYAKISPLEFSDVTKATQMMLGFNIEAEKVPKFISAIGDVSMGESGKFNSLTLAFSQMSAAGKLMGQDLNQMINAGFNPLQIMADKTGKSISTLKDEMSKGAISAEMVQQAFIDATSAGGKFYNMSENASKTINGQLSMMQDAMDAAFNEMGQKSESVIMKGIQTTTSLIENYETVGKVLVGLIATYGAYRAAVMLVTAAESKHTLVEIGLTNVRVLARKAQLALNAAMLTNPYVALATVVVGLGVAMWALHDSTSAAEKAQKRLNEQKEQSVKKEQEHKQRLEELITAIQNEYTSSMDRVKAMEAIKHEYPALFQKYIDEKGHIKDLIALWKEYNEETGKEKVKENKANYSNSQKLISEYERVIGLWKRFGEDPNFHKNNLTDAEKLLAEKYKNETLSTLKSKLDEERNIFTNYQKEVRSDEIIQWQLDLKKSTDVQIKSELNEMKRLQQARKNNKWYSLNIGVGSLKGATTESELQNRIDILESELKSRKTSTYKQDYEKAKKDWEDAKKKLSEIEKDKSKFTSKQYEEAKKQEETTEKAYKNLGGVTSNKLETEAEKQKKEQEKIAEELLSLRRQNQQAEIDLMKEGQEKKLKQIEFDYQKELDAIKKLEKEWAEKQGGKLTTEQSIDISARYTNVENKKDKSIADITKEQLEAERQALNDYLKEYGTFQQQKLAIAQEYAEKIKKVQEENGVDSAQVKLLEKQRDVAIQSKETEAIKANINWVTVFGEFGGMFNDMVKPALEEAKKYVRTDKFKNSDQASQKALLDAINQMEKSLGKAGGLNFKKLGQDIKTYQMAEQDRLIAIEDEKTAQDKLIKAQEDYEKALKNSTKEEKQAAKDALDIAQQNADTASANVRTQTDIANESQQNLTNTATNLRTNMNNVVEGLSKLASGGISSAYQGLLQAGSAMKGAIGEVTKNLKDVPIIGWIVAIIDVFKDGLSVVIGGLLDAVFNAVSGIIDDVLSGDLFVTIGESLVKGVSKIFDAITWGGFSSWTNSGESDPELEKDIELLTTSNQDLKSAIDNLADKMDSASVFDSTELYNQQTANLKQQMDNTQEMMRRSAEAYSNGFLGIGGSHSSNKKINDAMSSADWGRISNVVGTTVSSAGDFWNLTSEQMALVASEATDLYSKIKNAADDGYEDAAQYMDSYIGYYKELEELQNRYHEKLTSISFDSVKDNFRNSLLEMKNNTKAFAEDVEEIMQNALLEIMMTGIYDKELQRWYDDFAKRVESGGELNEAEIEASKQEYMAIVDRAKAEWEKYQDIVGADSSSSSQESTKKGFAAASQDSIDELNGRFTALQISGEEIKNQNALQTQSLNLLTVKADDILHINTEVRNIADDTRDLIANSYLELVQISENTGAIIKPIQQIQKDIADVKNNTKGLSTK